MSAEKKPVEELTEDEIQELWWKSVNSMVRLGNRLNKINGGSSQAMIGNAMLYAATHYCVYEITEGGSLPGDIIAMGTNGIYGNIVQMVNAHTEQLQPPSTVH